MASLRSGINKGILAVWALAFVLVSCDLIPGLGPGPDSSNGQDQPGPQGTPQILTRVMTTMDELTYAECSTETLQIHAFFNPSLANLTSVTMLYRYAQPSTGAASDWIETPMEPNGNVLGDDRYTFTLNDMAEHQGVFNGGEGRLEYRVIAEDTMGRTTAYPEQEYHYNALLISPCPTQEASILRVSRTADVIYYPNSCEPNTVDLELVMLNPDLVSAVKIEYRYNNQDNVSSDWYVGLMQYVGFSVDEGLFRFTINSGEAEALLNGGLAQIEYRFIVFTADQSFTWPSADDDQAIAIAVEPCSANPGLTPTATNTPLPTYALFPTATEGPPAPATPTITPEFDS